MENKVKNQNDDYMASQMISMLKSNYHKLWIITIIALLMLCVTGCYLVYVLNDTMVIETNDITDTDDYDITQESESGNNNFVNGDNNEVSNG